MAEIVLGIGTSHSPMLSTDPDPWWPQHAEQDKRIMNEKVVPAVPISINTCYPPNQPTPKRSHGFGLALRDAIRSWDGDARVAVVGSGGLSHFAVDEEIDRRVIKAFEDRDVGTLWALPRERMNFGASEIRNWTAAAAMTGDMDFHLVDHIPCCRSPAGTGCGMGFAYWS